MNKFDEMLDKALSIVFENQSTNEPHQSHNTPTLGATFGAANLAHKKSKGRTHVINNRKKQLAPVKVSGHS